MMVRFHFKVIDIVIFLFFILLAEPFEVGFVETSYTVREDVGTVEVCVNLTQPQIDILDEFVAVKVFDFPSSVYIPADVTLASESLLYKNYFLLLVLNFQLRMFLDLNGIA